MWAKLEPGVEHDNEFFTAMVSNLNPYIYKLSSDRFVWMNSASALTGNVGVPGAHVEVYINGVKVAETDALGDGSFSVNIYLVKNENEIEIKVV